MLEKKFLDLLVRLHKKTMERKLEWTASFYDDKAFRTKLGDFAVTIGLRNDPDYPDQPDYVVQILGGNDKVLEEFSNVTLRGLSTNDTNAYSLLDETYTNARRAALGVESAVESLLENLEDEK